MLCFLLISFTWNLYHTHTFEILWTLLSKYYNQFVLIPLLYNIYHLQKVDCNNWNSTLTMLIFNQFLVCMCDISCLSVCLWPWHLSYLLGELVRFGQESMLSVCLSVCLSVTLTLVLTGRWVGQIRAGVHAVCLSICLCLSVILTLVLTGRWVGQIRAGVRAVCLSICLSVCDLDTCLNW